MPTFELTHPIQFAVPGRPVPAGSKRPIPFKKANGTLGVRTIDDSGQRAKDWRATVAAQAFSLVPAMSLTVEPIIFSLFFFLQRPNSHYRAGDRSRELKEKAPKSPPIKRPDALKLARCVEDALTGVVWADDSQIVDEHIYKRWADAYLTIIRIEAWHDSDEDGILDAAPSKDGLTTDLGEIPHGLEGYSQSLHDSAT